MRNSMCCTSEWYDFGGGKMMCSPCRSSCLWPSSGYFSNCSKVSNVRVTIKCYPPSLSARPSMVRILRYSPNATTNTVQSENSQEINASQSGTDWIIDSV